MKKCLGKSHLDILVTKESCSLEQGRPEAAGAWQTC